ncbi:hypothetical protein [Streptomyces sp. NPDC046909]|uniref:hypothetical protein n=1 Tax=Streptomyces sp. NPDC046909 TaxID=3155617 RepID=UPI0033EC3807
MTSPDELGDRSPGKYYLVLEPDAAPLRRNLHEFASDAPDGRTIPELTRYALSETVHQPGQVIDAIRQLRNVSSMS